MHAIRQLFHYREAIRTLVARDLTVRYSGSMLGFFWGLLNPLLMTAVYTAVFGFFFNNQIAHFPVFVLCGLLPWSFFQGAVLGAGTSITGNGHLISRVFFPRDILPIAVVLANLVNFVLALGVLILLVFLYQIPLSWSWLLLPIIIALQTLFVIGLGLALATLNVYFRDTQQIIEVVLQALFFLTPIFYSIDSVGRPMLRWGLLALNPIAALIVAYRDILYGGHWPDLNVLAITTLEIVALLSFGYWFFHRHSAGFVEEL